MKIKKPLPSGGAKPAGAAAPATGGAAISDRFKLEPVDNGKKSKSSGAGVSKTSVLIGLVGAALALAVAGMLVYTLYSHWDALKFA